VADPEELLFVDKSGRRGSLQDVIYDGLDNDYSDRVPQLVQLIREGQPPHRLYATVMLVSWGIPEGYASLARWASDPARVPWASAPFTLDRQYGVDSTFEMLVDAIRTAGELDERDELKLRRIDGLRDLLGIYDRVFFGRSIMTALDFDKSLIPRLENDIARAVDRAVAASSGKLAFDMASQAAFLLRPLAMADDDHAARAAGELLAAHPSNDRMAAEVAHALGAGTGSATRALLERLASSSVEAVRKDAVDSLAKRGA
jgi:hypothetical protein